MIETNLIYSIRKYQEDHEGNLPREIIMEPSLWLEITGNREPPTLNDGGTYRYMGIPVRLEDKLPDELPPTDYNDPVVFCSQAKTWL